jgi:SAM-dependent methyltransferase
MSEAEFDRYAASYEALHSAAVSASGEDLDFFAGHKRDCLERCLGKGFDLPILDYGCGTGTLTRRLSESFPRVHGYDPSPESLTLARDVAPRATFHSSVDALHAAAFGAVVIANVLHHVVPPERPGLLSRVASLLRPGGEVFVFEHNPLNPLTRRAVGLCPFDVGATLLYPWETTRLLREAGLDRVTLDFVVFFPRALAFLRPLEPRLAWLPLGAQVLARGRAPGGRWSACSADERK